jgi:hypothetical protein
MEQEEEEGTQPHPQQVSSPTCGYEPQMRPNQTSTTEVLKWLFKVYHPYSAPPVTVTTFNPTTM